MDMMYVELERAAYQRGDTELADLYALIVELQSHIDELEKKLEESE